MQKYNCIIQQFLHKYIELISTVDIYAHKATKIWGKRIRLGVQIGLAAMESQRWLLPQI